MRLIILIAPLLFACGITNQSARVISINSQASTCEGFKELAKIKAIGYQQDTVDYCTAEKLRWKYSDSSKVLSFLHTRNKQNCGAKLEMAVTKNGETYVIEERDNGNSLSNCLCYFDTYCEVPNVEKTSIVVNIESQNYNLDLSTENGVVVIDTTHTWPCLGRL
ncbi:MAG: hypothetical protein PHC61_08330 [Chitinivibrionales bacterium]|nr:hypothetical protein [Chitinivibrionales bacterium]